SSTRATEEVTFCPGELTMTTVNTWKAPMVESIRKNILTNYDLSIRDVDGNELSIIPNILYAPSYVTLQVLDFEVTSYYSVEILYKLAYYPFRFDEDEFIVGHSAYDKAIYWKYMEHEYARNKDIDGSLA